MKLLSLLVLIFITLHTSPRSALACFGERPRITLEELVKNSDVIFLGKILDTSRTPKFYKKGTLVKYKIINAYKGISATALSQKVLYPQRLSAHNSIPRKGTVVIVGANKKDKFLEPVTFSTCSARAFSSYDLEDYFPKSKTFQANRTIIYASLSGFLLLLLLATLFLIYKRQKNA